MSMVEVDPKLFITCRLCLDEMGLYQIVPKVQMQIKYCFEIDVQPFDGLPQLICKKCESILSQYAGIKQMYQAKQNTLKTVKKSHPVAEENIEELNEKNNTQQQDTVSSTQQVETVSVSTGSAKKTNKQKLSLTKKVHTVDCESSSSKSKEIVSPIKPFTNKNQEQSKQINKGLKPKRAKSAWASNYTRQFVCRICSKTYCEKRSVISHINKHEDLTTKFSTMLNTHCEVKLNKVDSTPNITNTDENVVISGNKIIKSVNSKYYIIYRSNSKKESSSSFLTVSSSESSDEEIVRNSAKYKRQRLISDESTKSPLIMEQDQSQTSLDIDKQPPDNSTECKLEPYRYIDCVNIDSDTTSTQSDRTTKVLDKKKPQVKLHINKKLIGNIISMCYTKYLKRFDNKSVSKRPGNIEDSLLHKVLSTGTKIVHSRGPKSTGLLRYLEHRNLDISWLHTKDSNSLIIVKTCLVDTKSSNNDINDLGFKNLNEVDQNHTTKDFVDIFENLPLEEYSPPLKDSEFISEISQKNIEKQISTNISHVIFGEDNMVQKKKVNTDNPNDPLQSTNTVTENPENAVLSLRTALETDKQLCKKILNANPVPYPKQLPTKKTSAHETPTLPRIPPHAPGSLEAQRSENGIVNFNDVPNMPVITAMVSLAPLAEKQKQKQRNSKKIKDAPPNGSETNLPQIKVKPISELMPDRTVQSTTPLVNMPGWTVTSSNPNDSVVLQATNPNLVYLSNVPQYQQETTLCYPQILCSVNQANSSVNKASRHSDSNGCSQRKVNQEFVYMHTVELPNTKTVSPFRYFQRLLQIHNLILLESTVSLSYTIYSTMKCLIKFSLGFQQENNAPVTLCLTLYSDKNIFCIKVRDNSAKDIDISKLSANWQWEILKVFKGDIVTKLNINSLKYGLDMNGKVSHFVSLLKAIVFSKEL